MLRRRSLDLQTAERMEFWGRVCGIVGGALMGLSTFLSVVSERTLLRAEKAAPATQATPTVSAPPPSQQYPSYSSRPPQRSGYPSGSVFDSQDRTIGGGVADDEQFY